MNELKENDCISLHKVQVHNLKSIDLKLPYNKLIVFCGLSGSGKSSLAIDTLYAEGQRRYIESFSAYTRQFLEKLEKPAVERIDGIPPAIAVTSRHLTQLCRSTVGTSTETSDYLRLLFSKIGEVHCEHCGRIVRKDSPETILESYRKVKDGTRILIAFSPSPESYQKARTKPAFEAEWREKGFTRGIVNGENFRLDEEGIPFDKFAAARLLYLADLPVQEKDLGDPSRDQEFFAPEKDNMPDPFEFFENEEGEGENEQKESSSLQEEEISDSDLLEEDSSGKKSLSENELDESPENDLFEEDSLSGEFSEDDFKASTRLLTIDPEGDRKLLEFIEHRKAKRSSGSPPPLFFVVDRLTVGKSSEARLLEALETAFAYGDSQCWVFCEGHSFLKDSETNLDSNGLPQKIGKQYSLDGEEWTLVGFSKRLRCEDCEVEYPELEPKLFSFNSPLGACPVCEGFGNLMVLDLDLIIPNKNKSLEEGAIAPWNSASYKHKRTELLEKAQKFGVRTDVPYSELTEKEVHFVLKGNSEYEGLDGFFTRLQKQKYKMHIRVFLSRWRSYRVCPLCKGARLRTEALAVQLGKFNIQDFSIMQISDFIRILNELELSPWQEKVGKDAFQQVRNRLSFLLQVGLGYLTLDRPVRTLSEGEQRRVCLTSVLGSSLVDVLYVLDEPSIGLHPHDTQRLLDSILRLRDRGNTVVVVEHEESILKAADRIVEIGPEAGLNGGQVVFEGTFDEIKQSEKSLTGSYLSGRRSGGASSKRRILENGFIELTGASGNNLKKINAVFPLGVLCLVTGVSGAGKSTLVQDTLYPAVCRKLGKNVSEGLPFDQILGVGQIDDVILVDQTPIGRSPRSNPVTYLKIFDDIRNLFADTPDAKARNYNAGYFSFNVDGGRCNTCKGEGYVMIDMQFMADTYMRCPQCNGKRYQHDILDVLYRGKNISEVLDLTVREAFGFFRGQPRIQQKLKRLMDVGLDYIQLGQPANTLSGGESQRLKLVSCLSNVKKNKCLFILDEPTTGLHFADVVQLIDSFDALIQTGHSLIVVEHNLQMMRAADYIIDLGPGAAAEGGSIVAEGTPEEIARHPESRTGKALAETFRNFE
ncbi:MAG: excinuclease ABC subunit UvrA [Planctomycetia bacterium]|nr:excinuclease ABC subunit UvrA [Planctomycetia bacterium]